MVFPVVFVVASVVVQLVFVVAERILVIWEQDIPVCLNHRLKIVGQF